MPEYPKRPKFFAHKFCRLMTKSAAAMAIGPDACWLLTVVVHQEDSARYQKPIDYWNCQLLALCGFGSRKRLVTVRTKAIEAGWLHYEAGTKSKPGKYWVTLPDGLAFTDGDCSESDLAISGVQIGTESKTFPPRNETANGFASNESERNFEHSPYETERQRGAIRNGKSAPSIPTPSPIPKVSTDSSAVVDIGFDLFWKIVHRKEGKKEAKKAFTKAVKDVVKDQGITTDQASTYLTERMRKFAGSPQAADSVKGTLHPSTWLNQGRYEDDDTIWFAGQNQERDTARRIS